MSESPSRIETTQAFCGNVSDLIKQTNRFVAESDLERILKENRYDINPQKHLWVDTYPQMTSLPSCDPNQMLKDWQEREYRRIVFLYFHFPFCAQRCEFCYYHISTDQTYLEDYLQALEKEGRAFLKHLPSGATAGDLFFGGGTPSLVPPKYLQKFYDMIYEYIDRDSINMITLELHPKTMRKDIHELAKSGHIKRISMGVQTFSEKVCCANGRIWVEPERIRQICTQFRQAGIESIGLDFMVGLYEQTINDVAEDLNYINSFIEEGLIDSVSVYPRSFTDNSLSWQKEVIDAKVILEKLRSHVLYRYFFENIGWKEPRLYLFTPKQISQVAPSATVNQPMTAQVLGLGNSGRSTFDGTNYLNIKSYNEYLKVTKNSLGGTGSYQRLTKAENNRRHLVFGAKRGYINCQNLPVSLTDKEQEELAKVNDRLNTDGLITQNGDEIEVTPLGALLIEELYQTYDQTFRN